MTQNQITIIDPQYDIVASDDEPADLARQAGEYARALVSEAAREQIRDAKHARDLHAALISALRTIATTGSELRRKNYMSAIRAFYAFRRADHRRMDAGQILRWRQSLINAVKTDARGKPILDPQTKKPIPLYKNATVNAKCTAVRALLRTAAKAARLPDNKVMLYDMAEFKGVKTNDDPAAKWITAPRHTQDEIKRALWEIDGKVSAGEMSALHGARLKALIALNFLTGGRITELSKLSIRNTLFTTVTKDGETFNVVFFEKGTKFGKQRSVPLEPSARRYVEAWLELAGINARAELDTPIFRAFYKGGRVRSAGASARTLQSELENAKLKALKVNDKDGIEAHNLRRSFARACIDNGMTYAQVQKLLGHSSITTTERYIGRFDLTADDMPRISLD